jgi:thiosulfate/3-mercaptopyruvate sulfurtransferase
MRILRDDVSESLGRPDVVLLDGRSPEEYRGERVGAPGSPDVGAMCYGRIPGARHVYFEELLNPDKTLKPREELKAIFEARGVVAGKGVITYCRLSHRATVLYLALTEILGLANVRVYDGSWTEWGNAVGLPVER